jgi:GNAT superfamily N-acetyltransferase
MQYDADFARSQGQQLCKMSTVGIMATILRASASNKDYLYDVIQYLQRDIKRHFRDPASKGSWWYNLDDIIKCYWEGTLLVAYIGKSLCGFASFTRGADSPGTIDILEVLPAYRLRGIGKLLVQRVEAESIARVPGSSYLRINIPGPCIASLGFWERVGFVPFPDNTLLTPMFKKLSSLPIPNIVKIGHLDRFLLRDALWERAAGAPIETSRRTQYSDEWDNPHEGRVDYYRGCAIKSHLFTPSDFADSAIYNKYHGEDAFEQVVAELSAKSLDENPL